MVTNNFEIYYIKISFRYLSTILLLLKLFVKFELIYNYMNLRTFSGNFEQKIT